jgi:opacity protein-like surface antigen
MKKLLVILWVSLAMPAVAQEGYFSIYYMPNIPLGETQTFTNEFSWRGVGMEFGGFVNDELSLGVCFDWAVFYEARPNELYTLDTRSIFGNQFRYINMFPILAQARYWIEMGNAQLYLGGTIGPTRVNEYIEVGYFSVQDLSWNFSYGGEIGLFIPFNFDSGLLLGARYLYVDQNSNNNFNHQMVNLKVGFQFH